MGGECVGVSNFPGGRVGGIYLCFEFFDVFDFGDGHVCEVCGGVRRGKGVSR